MNRSYKDGQQLTKDELTFIVSQIKMGHCSCPDCGEGFLLAGPSGGGCQNFKCDYKYCGSMFSNMGMFGIERISDPSPNKFVAGPSNPEGPYR